MFDSDTIDMGLEYLADLAKCLARFKAISDHYSISKSVPRWKQVLDPVEREILNDVELLSLLGTAHADEMALHYRNGYGAALQMASAKRGAEFDSPPQRTEEARVADQLQAILLSLLQL
jgi:hypothetical protein